MKSLLGLFIISGCLDLTVSDSDPKTINVFGPGLNPSEIVMPARYFFVNLKAQSTSNLKFKYSPSFINDLSVSVSGKYIDNQRECRVWVNILDRKDGIFIVRYKVHEPCSDFKINVKFKGIHIGDSPYSFNGIVRPEECYCPEESVEKWLENYQCLNRSYKQIYEDLKPFPSVNFTMFRKEALKKFDHPGSMSVCNYVVVKNKIHRKCYGEHVGFKMFVDAILLSLTRKTVLPDIEILVNLGDWPLMKKDSKNIYPLFSWCGSENSFDIVMPTYDITESSLECMGRVSLDMLSVQGNIKKSWDEKENKAFWRGRDSSRERLKLIEIARQNPDLFNASLVNFFFFRDLESQYGPKEKYISFFEFFNYKYQLNLDGTVAAYRFPYLLIGDSVVLKQESVYYEHFYNDLKPFHHYVPFKQDLSNLVNQLKWAIDHETEVKKISENGRNYAEENLLPQNIFCYHAVLFYEWSKRLVSEVKIRKNMEYVPQPEQIDCFCDEKFLEKKFSDEL